MRNQTNSDAYVVNLRALLLPSEVAALLRCSEWWVKDQARNGHVPYVRVAGSYRFTEAHVLAIIERLEVQPTAAAVPVAAPGAPVRVDAEVRPVTHLRARVPRRARLAAEQSAAA